MNKQELREQFERETGKSAMIDGILTTSYAEFLEARLSTHPVTVPTDEEIKTLGRLMCVKYPFDTQSYFDGFVEGARQFRSKLTAR